MVVIFASTSFYEILLIILVIILIFNGLLRREVLKKVNNKLDNSNIKQNEVNHSASPKNDSKIEGEYVDYEIIKD